MSPARAPGPWGPAPTTHSRATARPTRGSPSRVGRCATGYSPTPLTGLRAARWSAGGPERGVDLVDHRGLVGAEVLAGGCRFAQGGGDGGAVVLRLAGVLAVQHRDGGGQVGQHPIGELGGGASLDLDSRSGGENVADQAGGRVQDLGTGLAFLAE